MADTVFTRLYRGELPCAKLYEDRRVFAFMVAGQVNFPLCGGMSFLDHPIDLSYKFSRRTEYFAAKFAALYTRGLQLTKNLPLQLPGWSSPRTGMRDAISARLQSSCDDLR